MELIIIFKADENRYSLRGVLFWQDSDSGILKNQYFHSHSHSDPGLESRLLELRTPG